MRPSPGRASADDIDARLTDIDGAGGMLGQAGPTYLRTADSLPVAATMEFDLADAATFDALGLWGDIVLHEMLHSIGFGTIWDRLDLLDTHVDDNGTRKPTDDIVDYRFNGSAANAAFSALYPALDDGLGIPVETDGGPGTAGGHWDDTFGSELMTGYIDPGGNVLSDRTITSLEDLGYQTVWHDEPLIA